MSAPYTEPGLQGCGTIRWFMGTLVLHPTARLIIPRGTEQRSERSHYRLIEYKGLYRAQGAACCCCQMHGGSRLVCSPEPTFPCSIRCPIVPQQPPRDPDPHNIFLLPSGGWPASAACSRHAGAGPGLCRPGAAHPPAPHLGDGVACCVASHRAHGLRHSCTLPAA